MKLVIALLAIFVVLLVRPAGRGAVAVDALVVLAGESRDGTHE